MQIVEIKGTDIDLTDAIKEYIDDKLKAVAKLTEKFEPCDLRVEVGKTTKGQRKGDIFRCEFNLTLPGVMLRAETIKDDLYAAIDVAVGELRRQVKKYKEKLRDADRVVMDTTIEEHTEEF